jgi:hypothetical protein
MFTSKSVWNYPQTSIQLLTKRIRDVTIITQDTNIQDKDDAKNVKALRYSTHNQSHKPSMPQ